MKQIILPLAFILFLLTACGKGSEETAQIPSTSTPIALPPEWTTTPAVDVFAGWVNYSNQEHGYQIKHPPGWMLFPSTGSEQKVSIESEHCVFTIEGGNNEESELHGVILPPEECSIGQVVINDVPMTLISCPDGYTEFHFPGNGEYLIIQYGEKIQDKDTSPSNLKRCQEYFDQMLSTFNFFGPEKEEKTILDIIIQKLPDGFQIEESFYVDINGDGIDEIVVVRGPYFEESPDIYIFKQDPITTAVREIHFEEGYGIAVNQFSTSDIDTDGKEELLILLNLGGKLNVADWYFLSEKDGEIRKFSPPPKSLSDFGLGEEYSISGRKRIRVWGEGLIIESIPIQRIIEMENLQMWAETNAWLHIKYKFQDNSISISSYELNLPLVNPQPTPTPTPKPTMTPIIIGPDWKVFRSSNYGFRIMHPEKISITKEETGILLHHSIPHEHRDPCDFRGNAPPLQELTDFEVWIEVVPQSLRETIILMEMEDYVQEFLGEDEILLKPGYSSKEIVIGSLRGYSIKQGVEGCGRYVYLFPLSDRSTLHIVRSIVTELTDNITNYQEYLALPGIIPPEEEEALFLKILSTFEVIE